MTTSIVPEYSLPFKAHAAQFSQPKKVRDGFMVKCPLHADTDESVSFRQMEDGSRAVHCFGSCDNKKLWEAMIKPYIKLVQGKRPSKEAQEKATDLRRAKDLTPLSFPCPHCQQTVTPNLPFQKQGTSWPMFRCSCGKSSYQDLMSEFLKHFPDGVQLSVKYDGVPDANDKPKPLYAHRIDPGKVIWGTGTPLGSSVKIWQTDTFAPQPGDSLVICEGEKAAVAFFSAGQPGYWPVSWRGGGQSADKVKWDSVNGRDVILWPDNDDAGVKARDEMARRCLDAGATSIRLIDVSSLPDKGDAADVPCVAMPAFLNGATAFTPPPAPPPPPSASAGTIGSFTPDLEPETANDMYAIVRLILAHSGDLVVARDLDLKEGVYRARIYAVESTGMLSEVHADTLLRQIYLQYLADNRSVNVDPTNDKPNRRYGKCFDHATSILNRGLAKIADQAIPVLGVLEAFRAIPTNLVVVEQDAVDTNLRFLGTRGGILDLHTGQILSPAAGRHTFTMTRIRDDYDKSATHKWVDLILPPVPSLKPGSIEHFRAQVLAFGFTHEPAREFICEQCEAGSGKTTFRNALQVGFGPYVGGIRRDALMKPAVSHGSTTHNGDWRHFGPPVRLLFCAEFNSTTDKGKNSKASAPDWETLRAATGGDTVEFRAIHKEDDTLSPTALFWIQGNIPKQGEDVLGLSEGTDTAQALLDRAKILTRQRIPSAQQDRNLALYGKRDTADEKLFRQAVVARVVEYCQNFATQPFPSELDSLKKAKEDAVNRGKALWEKEWLPFCVTDDPELADNPETNHHRLGDDIPPLNSFALYQNYLQWHDAKGEGRTLPRRPITEKVVQFYQLPEGRRGKVASGEVNQQTGSQKRHEAQFWDDWYLADPEKVSFSRSENVDSRVYDAHGNVSNQEWNNSWGEENPESDNSYTTKRHSENPENSGPTVFCQPSDFNPATCAAHDKPILDNGRCPQWDKLPKGDAFTQPESPIDYSDTGQLQF